MYLKATLLKMSWGVAVALLLFSCAAPAARVDTLPTPTPSASPTASALDEKKKEAELEKLKQEVAGLKISNEALDVKYKWATTWITALGGIVIALLVGYFNLTQNRKLKQDKRLGREEHLLKVFHDLGDNEPRIRVGAVAVLAQRLNDLRKQKEKAEEKCGWIRRIWRRLKRRTSLLFGKEIFDPEELKEFPTIISVLISVSKNETEMFVQKYIADGIANGLGAIIDPEQSQRDRVPKPSPATESPLKKFEFQGAKFLFDFQGARLRNAWWYSIDARGVDLYEANLSEAGLREAFLEDAVLKKAKLIKTTLARAHMKKAQLQECQLIRANLRGADLTEADLSGANLQDAKLSKSESNRGNKITNLTGAILKGANLTNADLSDADLRGADLRGANLAGANVKGTKFSTANVTGVDFSSVLNLSDADDLNGAVGYVPPP